MKTTQLTTASRTWIEISWQSITILAICLFDLLSTIWLLETGLATEANPLMAYLLEHGMGWFCGIKMGTVFCLVAVTEWYRKHNPVFVRNIMWVTITGYITIYVVLLIKVNFA